MCRRDERGNLVSWGRGTSKERSDDWTNASNQSIKHSYRRICKFLRDWQANKTNTNSTNETNCNQTAQWFWHKAQSQWIFAAKLGRCMVPPTTGWVNLLPKWPHFVVVFVVGALEAHTHARAHIIRTKNSWSSTLSHTHTHIHMHTYHFWLKSLKDSWSFPTDWPSAFENKHSSILLFNQRSPHWQCCAENAHNRYYSTHSVQAHIIFMHPFRIFCSPYETHTKQEEKKLQLTWNMIFSSTKIEPS